MAKVSIVLPVYNGGDFIEEAIESVLQQTFKDFELIIVDDCSIDETPDILKKYSSMDARIVISRNTQNLKLPMSLNSGFEIASGDWHTWISHDNKFDSNFLEEMLKFAEETGSDFVYSGCRLIDPDGHLIRNAAPQDSEKLILGNVIGASFLYKKEVFESSKGYDPLKFMYEDYAFWVEAKANLFTFAFSQKVLYSYRIHNEQLTKSQKMPQAFVDYRLSVLNLLPVKSKLVKVEATLSILHIALNHRNWNVALRVALFLTSRHPVLLIRTLKKKLVARTQAPEFW